jgi:hypothetical protein
MLKLKFGGFLTSTVLFGVLLTGCTKAEVEKEEKPAKTKESAEQVETKKEGQQTKFKVGEAVSVDGMEVTINKVTWGTPNQDVPTEHEKVLRVVGTAVNNDAENAFIDSTEFRADAGDTPVEYYSGNNDTNMFGGELKNGKKINIILEFDVPESNTYEIYYDASLMDHPEVKWIVTKEEIQ